MSDVRTCPTPYALDALAQPSKKILALRKLSSSDEEEAYTTNIPLFQKMDAVIGG